MPEAALATKLAAQGATDAVLAVRNLQAWYGESHILHGMNFDVRPGEVVTLLGRNGAGKSTTLKSLMGVVTPRSGSVKFDGAEVAGQKSYSIARQFVFHGIHQSAPARFNNICRHSYCSPLCMQVA